MSKMAFDTPEQAGMYKAGFQHAAEYMLDAWKLLQHRVSKQALHRHI